MTFSYACSDPSTLILAFRGSVNSENWKKNGKYELIDFPYAPQSNRLHVQVHTGFLESYQELRDNLRSALKTHMSLKGMSFTKFMFTGHSLGGAMAVIASLDLSDMYSKQNVGVITYGSPRIGNQNFSDLLMSKIGTLRRVVDKNDWVAQVPGTKYGYRHAGTELFNTNKHTMYVCNNSEDYRCSKKYRKFQEAAHIWYRGQHFFVPTYCNSTGIGQFAKETFQNIFSYITLKPVEQFCQKYFNTRVPCMDDTRVNGGLPPHILKELGI
jgi:hypothetical protein